MALNVQENVPLAPLTTFKIGGKARYFAEVSSEKEMREAIEWAKERNTRFILLAGGSNVLVPDEGLDALVVDIRGGKHFFAGRKLITDSGCNLLEIIRNASARGLGGWEKLSGIPGTIGGAIRGNAGAFGTEIKDMATEVQAININSLASRVFSNFECDYSYRHSFFKDNPEWFITKVTVELKTADRQKSTQLIERTIEERERRHLQNVQAAGSYFMNPIAPAEIVAMFEKEKGVKAREGRVPAGWLIEKAGMKGAKVGGAIASLQHPNYIVNEGSATALDVRKLAEKIKKSVLDKFSIVLEEEAEVMGYNILPYT